MKWKAGMRSSSGTYIPGIIMAYPTARRDTDSVVRAIKHFCGRRKIKQVYSDDGPELINACVS